MIEELIEEAQDLIEAKRILKKIWEENLIFDTRKISYKTWLEIVKLFEKES